MSTLVTVGRGGTSAAGWALATGRPAPWLRSVVASYDGYAEWSERPVARREVPVPSVVMILGFGGPLRIGWQEARSFVAGLSQASTLTEHAGSQRGVELRLSPLGAYRLFGLPMSELTDRVVELDSLWGRDASRLVERLVEAPGWPDRFAVLDEELTMRIDSGPYPDPELERAWQRLKGDAGDLRVSRLLDDTGWSRRRLAERFRQQTGLTAKALARVLRFDHAVRLLTGPGHRSLASVAVACGYYDQAHLNRDFRDLAGYTPTEFLHARRSDALSAAFSAVPQER